MRAAIEYSSHALGMDPQKLLDELRRGSPAAWSTFEAHATVAETYFFRNPQVWAAFRSNVAPAAARVAAAAGRPARIWCAGCSTGEEAYTIAIGWMLASGAVGRLEVIGVDVVPERLEFARRAVYSETSLRALSPEQIARWFVRSPRGHELRVPRDVGVRFATLNLADPPAVEAFVALEGPFDVVTCRNVLIYFDEPHAQRLLSAFSGALAPGGFVLTGAAELGVVREPSLELVRVGESFVLRRPLPGTGERETPLAAPEVPVGSQPSPRSIVRPSAAPRKVGRDRGRDDDLDPEVWFGRGLRAERAGELALAAEAFAGAAFLDAQFTLAYLHLAFVLAERGERRAAHSAAMQAVGALEKEDTRSSRLAGVAPDELARRVLETAAWLGDPA